MPGRVEEVVDAVQDGITIVDETCRITYANDAAARIFGMTREQLTGKFCDDRSLRLSEEGPSSDRQRRACCRPLATGEVVRAAERTVRRPDGSEVCVLAAAAPWRDAADRLVGVINSYTDITERKSAEDALRHSEERFRRFVETAQEGLWAQDADTRTTFVNGEMARMVGYSREEMIGKRVIDFVVPQDRDAFRAQMRARKKGQPSRYEMRLRRSDGSSIWVRVSATAVVDDSGTFRGAFAMIADITESKEADRALREGEERYRSLVDASPDAIVVYQRGMVTFVNPAAVAMFGGPGTTSDDLVGRPVMDFVHPASREIVSERMGRMRRQRKPLPPIEEKYVRLDGREMVVELAAIPFVWQGEPAVQVVARDITDRKRAEEDLRYARSQLERSLAFREALLSAVPTPVFYKDREGRYVGCNRAFTEFTGVTSEEISGKTVMELWPSENALVYHEKDLALMDHPEMQVYEFKVRDRHGVDHPVIFAKNVFLDENRQVAGIVGVFTDITERKQAEEALRNRDMAIRRAYVDVIAAVTGNRLILMTPDEIDASLGDPVDRSHSITSYRTLARARAEIRDAIERGLPDRHDTGDFIVGVGEALTNMVKHAGGGRYQVLRRDHTAQVVIEDRGPGVDFTTVPRATLEIGFSTKGTLGVGFTIMLETSDRVLLSTQPGSTILVLETGR